MRRDYLNEFSNIPLRAYEKLELTIGYKVYRSPSYVFPEHKGYTEKLIWVVAETPDVGALKMLAQTAVGLSLISMLLF